MCIWSDFLFWARSCNSFFLLSGFVIFANERDRAVHIRGYYLRRLRRTYAPFIAAVGISTLSSQLHLISNDFSWRELLGSVFGLQDVTDLKPGVLVEPFMGNSPLWSLSYEVFFYAIFPFVLRLLKWRMYVTRLGIQFVCIVALVSYFFWPNHCSIVLAYFLIWRLGATLAFLELNNELKVKNALIEIWGAVASVFVAGIFVFLIGFNGLGLYPFLILRHSAFALCAFIVALSPLRNKIISLFGRMKFPWFCLEHFLWFVHCSQSAASANRRI